MKNMYMVVSILTRKMADNVTNYMAFASLVITEDRADAIEVHVRDAERKHPGSEIQGTDLKIVDGSFIDAAYTYTGRHT